MELRFIKRSGIMVESMKCRSRFTGVLAGKVGQHHENKLQTAMENTDRP